MLTEANSIPAVELEQALLRELIERFRPNMITVQKTADQIPTFWVDQVIVHDLLKHLRESAKLSFHMLYDLTVRALDYRIDIVHAARVRAGPHRDHPARFEHLVVEPFDHRRHFHKHRAGYHDQICLPWRRSQYLRAESGNVELAGERGRHFHIATGKPKVERPNRVFPAPRNHVLKF